ncbi:hypothetical protein dqs_1905 [Azoarcus olearius]|uniref:DUF2231 domain-containing protein n=1 Tax=Azoarcus sp. (strain BH72) TaxID=418699 RepID=UPI0008060AE1|nr:DUF2231 domain-containing protein [Azoarcus olearius]ANQ84943.1 hypothetical protein dqs_1905 [Azoarcus olearius]
MPDPAETAPPAAAAPPTEAPPHDGTPVGPLPPAPQGPVSADPAADHPPPLPEPIVSRAALGGHPLHPMLIHFPVAALIALVGADLAWWMSADPFWARAGLWLAGVGAFGGWIASVTGLIDLLTVARIRAKITAWCHAVMAVMMLALASLNWLLRYRSPGPDAGVAPGTALDTGPALAALALTLLTALLIALASWLGGRLVYEHAVGVQHHPGSAP